MFSLKVTAGFSSAHNLRGYKGKCEELHGHNWKVEVVVSGNETDKIGMLIDFKYLKAELNKILEKLDHKYLNNLAYFKKINPTSENLARYIFALIKRKIPIVKSVTVWENDTSSATYAE